MAKTGVLSKIERVVFILVDAFVVISSISILGVVAVVFVHVIDRKFLNILNWNFVDEWIGYLFVLMVFFSISYTLRLDKHIKLSIMSRFMSQRTWTVTEIVTSLLSVPVALFVMYSTINRLLSIKEAGTVSNTPTLTPLWIPYVPIVVGLGVFILVLVLHVTRRMLEAKARKAQGLIGNNK